MGEKRSQFKGIFWGLACVCYLSKMMTVSAAVKLMPTPPARVDSRKTKEEASLLNRSMAFWRSLPETRPSRRSLNNGSEQGCSRICQKACQRSVWVCSKICRRVC